MRKVEKDDIEKPEVSEDAELSKQKEGWYKFFVVFLSLLLVATIALFLRNPLLPTMPKSTGLTPLGTDLQLTISDNGSASQTLCFYGSYLPNQGVNQLIGVSLKANTQNAKLRAKAFMYDENNNLIKINLETTTEWTFGEDEYYYYDGVLTPNLNVQFTKKIQTPFADAKLSSNNIYLIIVTFETLPENSNYQEIWKI